MYCHKVHQEAKKCKKKGKGKIMNDGDEFHGHAIHILTEQEHKEAALVERRQVKERQAGPMAKWKAQEVERKV